MITRIWRFLIGQPLPTEHLHHQRLRKFLALPVFASDNLSSTAYATQEIIIPLMLVGGIGAIRYALPVSLAIGALLVVVVLSYTQTIKTYPKGASCYLVAKDNLGTLLSLVAGAGLLTDYILTVAVSIAAGVEQITSAFPALHDETVLLNVGTVIFLTVVNLRGARESATVFAVPTYLFIITLYGLVLTGIVKAMSPGFTPLPTPNIDHAAGPVGAIGLILLLRAFSHGCTALTGVEAVSDGVGAFKPPEARNASIVLVMMATIVGSLFLGLSWLSQTYNAIPAIAANGHSVVVTDSLISVLGKAIWGEGLLYYVLTAATTVILLIAANTAFADFPRLSSFLATDRFLPHQFANVGDRLVFSNGILFLGAAACGLLVFFGGNNHMLLPLYAIGVFLSFTLSQSSMVLNWWRSRRPGWHLGMLLNGFGALCTTVVFVVLAWFRFAEGAWIVLLLIPALVIMFLTIKAHYASVSRQLKTTQAKVRVRHHTVLVLVPGLNSGVLQALEYATSLAQDVRAVHVDTDGRKLTELRTGWEDLSNGVPLVIIHSPYRSLLEPTLEYLEEVKLERAEDTVTVVIPEFVPRRWWHTFLHNQSGLMLKIALLFRRDIVVTNVRYWLD